MATSSSGIAHVEPDRIVVRGLDLCADLIGVVSFSQFFWQLVTGAPATSKQALLLDACMVAISEHGLVPSVQAARMTFASGPEALQGAVAAGLLGCGSVIFGASEIAGQMLAELVADAQTASDPPSELALLRVQALRANKLSLPGFGHPVHRMEDPRATRLLALADACGGAGPHVEMLRLVTEAIPSVYGRAIPLNVSGVIPAVLLDAGFPLGAIKGVPLVARCASLVAHLLEESQQPLGFALAAAAESALVNANAKQGE